MTKPDPLGMFFILGLILVFVLPFVCRAVDGSWKPFLLGIAMGTIMLTGIGLSIAVAVWLFKNL